MVPPQALGSDPLPNCPVLAAAGRRLIMKPLLDLYNHSCCCAAGAGLAKAKHFLWLGRQHGSLTSIGCMAEDHTLFSRLGRSCSPALHSGRTGPLLSPISCILVEAGNIFTWEPLFGLYTFCSLLGGPWPHMLGPRFAELGQCLRSISRTRPKLDFEFGQQVTDFG